MKYVGISINSGIKGKGNISNVYNIIPLHSLTAHSIDVGVIYCHKWYKYNMLYVV